MTDGQRKQLELAGATFMLDRVQLRHPAPARQVNPLAIGIIGSIYGVWAMQFGYWAIPFIGVFIVALFLYATKYELVVTADELRLQQLRGGRRTYPQVFDLADILKVEVLNPAKHNIAAGSLICHLSDGRTVRIYPCQNSHDARTVGGWLQERIEAASQRPVPESRRDELRQLQRLRDPTARSPVPEADPQKPRR